jgi:hypothetical protein
VLQPTYAFKLAATKRGQRLALRKPRQRLIPLMLGEHRLPSHEPGFFGSGQDQMAFEFGQSASSFRANNSDDFVDGALNAPLQQKSGPNFGAALTVACTMANWASPVAP